MKRALVVGIGFLIFFCSSVFQADVAQASVKSGRLDRDARTYRTDRLVRDGRIIHTKLSHLRGKRGRKYARRFSLRDALVGDKKQIYETHGYTPHRLGYYGYGRRTERWIYYGLGVEYTFDAESNLISTRHFPPEGNHID